MTPPLERYRAESLVFSHLDHEIKGGHPSVHSILSEVRHADAKAMPDSTISHDQRAAEVLVNGARLPSLTIGSILGLHGGCSMLVAIYLAKIPKSTLVIGL